MKGNSPGNDWKSIVFILFTGAALYGCSSSVRRQVIQQYDNGRPKKVIDRIDKHHYYEREMGESGELTRQQYFIDGVQDSFETYYNAEGKKLAELMFKGGKRNGVSHEFYSNGRIAFEGSCVDGRFEGLWTTFYNNGRIEERGYHHLSRLTGRWNFYDTAGRLVKAALYTDSLPAVYFDGCDQVITRQQWDSLKIMDQPR
jgi:antitoxin component YwqK of YwqJK toxin-antitoxin module